MSGKPTIAFNTLSNVEKRDDKLVGVSMTGVPGVPGVPGLSNLRRLIGLLAHFFQREIINIIIFFI